MSKWELRKQTDFQKNSKMRNIPSSLRNPRRNASTVVKATFTAIAPLLDKGLLTPAVLHAANIGTKFVIDANKNGLANSAKRRNITISESFIAATIAKAVWDNAQTAIDPKFTSNPYGNLTQIAFRKSLSAIVSKGDEALGE